MALDKFRRIDMQINRANDYQLETQFAKEGDYNGRELFVQITNGGEVSSQTGVSLNLGWHHNSVGNSGLDPFTVIDASKGIFKITYPTEMMIAGDVIASIQIIENKKITETRNFKITVEKSPVDEGTVVSSNSFTVLQDALLKVNDWDEKFEAKYDELETTYAENITELNQQAVEFKKHILKPQFVEFFGSFNRFGLGVPSGITNYAGGNYVLTVSGSAGDSFVTVNSGNIADAGATTRWACVIENNDGIFNTNQVTGTDGVSKINLLEPLTESIASKRLGNLHDAVSGQHYTELGYFAFAQHIYFENTRHTERNAYIAQMKPSDTSGSWSGNANYIGYNVALNMKNVNNYFSKIGSKHLAVNTTANTQYIEWEQSLSGKKGYLETYLGASYGQLLVEFYTDGILSETVTISGTAHRLTFDYENAQTGKIKITSRGDNGSYAVGTQTIYIGLTTWWENEKYPSDQLLSSLDKIAYIGDSWGVYHNEATIRELERLTNTDVLNYSKSGHTSDYAVAWFENYVINSKPDKVIIEYFVNDFNSVSGANVGTFVNPQGQTQSMAIASQDEYVANINYMIDLAIENGIQPIVLMPASTNSESQTQNLANYSVSMFLGNATTIQNVSFKTVSTDKLTVDEIASKPGGGVGVGTLKLKSNEVSSSVRKGIMSDTSSSITSGDIHGFYNNGAKKASVTNNGTLVTPFIQLQKQENSIPANANNRGQIYVLNSALSSNIDELRVVIQLADGSFVTKKIQLTD